jgi:hypothetical protein
MGEPAALTRARRASAIACATALLAALAYPLLQARLLMAFHGFYPEHEAWRQLQLEERSLSYESWLFLLFGGLVCWSIVLLRAQDANALADRLRRAGPILFVSLVRSSSVSTTSSRRARGSGSAGPAGTTTAITPSCSPSGCRAGSRAAAASRSCARTITPTRRWARC